MLSNQSPQKSISCQNLLGQNPSHFGYLKRKEKVLSIVHWNINYVILKEHILYIYPSANSKRSTLTCCLMGYERVEEEISSNNPQWILKLSPMMTSLPTLIFSAASKSELIRWVLELRVSLLQAHNKPCHVAQRDLQAFITTPHREKNLHTKEEMYTDIEERDEFSASHTSNYSENEFGDSAYDDPTSSIQHDKINLYEHVNLFETPLPATPHSIQQPSSNSLSDPVYTMADSGRTIAASEFGNFEGSNDYKNNNAFITKKELTTYNLVPANVSETTKLDPQTTQESISEVPVPQAIDHCASFENFVNDVYVTSSTTQRDLEYYTKADFYGTREEAKSVIQSLDGGTFLVRHHQDRHVLTVRSTGSIVKYELQQDSYGNTFIYEQTSVFNNLIDLLNYYHSNNLPTVDFRLKKPYKLC